MNGTSWSDATNWSDNATSGGNPGNPGSGDTAVFNQSSANGPTLVQLDNTYSIAGLVFNNTGTTQITSTAPGLGTLNIGATGIVINSGAGAVTLGDAGNTMGVVVSGTQSWTNNSSSTMTVLNGVNLGASNLTLDGSGSFNFSGAISGSGGGITLGGGATATLSGSNSYSGDTIVNPGTTLNINSDTALGSGNLIINGGTINNTSGAAHTLTNAQQWFGDWTYGGTQSLTFSTGGVNLNASVQVTTNAPGTLTVGGGITGSGFNITKAGVGSMVLSGVVGTGTGGITISAGTLTLSGGAANTYTGNTTLASGAQLNFNKSGAVGTSAGTLIINGGTLDNTSGGPLANAANNPMQWNGDFIFLGGTGTTHDLNLGTGAVTLSANRQVTVNAGILTVGGGITGSGSTLTKAGAGMLVLNGVIGTGAGGLAVNGGTLTVGNAGNTFTGNVTIDGAGTVLQMAGSNGNATSAPLGFANLTPTAFKTVTLTNGAIFRATSNYNVNVPAAATPGGGYVFVIGSGGGTFDTPSGVTLTVDDGTTGITGTGLTAQELQGTGPLTKTGTGILILRQQFGFGGTINIAAGTLQITGANTTGAFGVATAGTTIQSGAALDINGLALADVEPLNISGTGLASSPKGAITNSSATAASFAGPITLGANSSIGAAAAGGITLSGTIGGAFSLTNASAGSGVVTLSNTLSNAGVIQNSPTSVLVVSGTNTSYTGGFTIVAGQISFASPATSAGAAGNVITLGTAATPATGAILQSTNSQTWLPSIVIGANSNGGTLTIQQGTTAAAVFSGAVSTSSPFTVLAASSGSVTLSGSITNTAGSANNITLTNNSTAAAGLTLSGASINPAGSILSGGTGTGSTVISGALGGNVVNITQSGTTTLLLSGTDDNTGINTASAGTLQFAKRVSFFNADTSKWIDTKFVANSGATIAFNVGGTGEFTAAEFATLSGIGTATGGFKSGSSIGLDTTSGNVSYSSVIANPNSGTNALGLAKLGANTLTLTNTNTYTGATQVLGGQLRADPGVGLPTSSLLTLNGGVIETSINLARVGGTAAGNMQITGGVSGFSANGGPVQVAFGTLAAPTTLTWGTAPFAPGTLVLNDTTANNTLTFLNAINLGTAVRTVNVNANAATMSGALSGAGGGITKSGTGSLTLSSSTNSFTGATTITGGTLTFAGAGSLPTASALTVNGGTTLQVFNDASGTISQTNVINVGGTQTIVVGNNGGATTGSTIAFGSLLAPATSVATATTTTFSSPNNYGLSFTTLSLAGALGQTTTLTANTNVAIGGNVTNRMSGFAAGNYDTLQLQGTSTGSAVNGIISDATGGGITASNDQGDTRLAKLGTGTWTLSAANSYTGGTTVSAGTLSLKGSAGGVQVIGASAVSVSAGATLNIQSNVSIGNGTATITNTQGSVVIAGGAAGSQGVLSLLDGALNTLTIKGNSFTTAAAQSLTLAGAAGSSSILNLETGASTVDAIVLSGGNSNKVTVGAGGVVINLTALPSTTLVPGTYNLMTFATGSTFTGGFSLSQTQFGSNVYSLIAPTSTSTSLQLVVSASTTGGDAYWNGAGTVWNTTSGSTSANFYTTAGGTALAGLPGSTTNVYFTGNSAAANFSTTLGQNFAINSLNFTGTGTPAATNAITIGGANTLTLNATAGFTDSQGTPVSYPAGTGLVVQPGSAAHTISAPVVLGATQSWEIDNTAGFNVTGAVSGAFSLTKTGTGTMTLSGANTFSGGLTIANGTVIANVANVGTASGAAGPSTSAITLGSSTGGAASLLANAFTITNPVNLGNNSAGTLTLGNNANAAAIFSAAIGLNSNNLTISAGGTGSTTISGGVTGTGNLSLVNGGTTSTMTLSTTQLNNAGSIASSGASTGLITLSAPIGSNVTNISHGSAGGLTFSSATVANNGNITFSGTGAGVVTFSAASINNTGLITNSGATTGTTTISGIIGTNVTGVVENSSSSTLVLTGANTFTSGVRILSGTASGTTSASAFGTGAITIGDTSGSANATLNGGFAGTFTNPISVASGNNGTATITTSAAAIFSGAVTLNSHNLTLLASGTGATTLTGGTNGTGNLNLVNSGTTSTITLSTTQLNNTGSIASSGASTGLITLSAPIGSNVTDISHGSAGGLTLSGATIANTGNITFSGTAAGVVTFSAASINNAGIITNSGATTGATTISGVLGSAVTGLTQNSASSAMTITSANPAFTGGVTVTAGTLNAIPTTATNSFTTLGTGLITLNGGTLSLKDNGTASFQQIVTGNGTVGNNLAVAATSTLNVDRNAANATNAYVFNNLSIGTATLNVTGGNTYVANIAGTTAFTGAGTLSPATAPLNLLGQVNAGSNTVTVSGAGNTRMLNTATGAGANVASGTYSVNGGNLTAYVAPSGAVAAGSSSLDAASIALSGTNPVFRIVPDVTSGLTNGTTSGLLDKSFTGVTSVAATSWLGPVQPAAGTNAQNLTGIQTIANLNYPSVNSNSTTSHQYTGLIKITTAGMYNFSLVTDDGDTTWIDGVPIINVTGNTTVAGSIYLAAGFHTFTDRWNNNGTNGAQQLSYQGPDTANVLGIVPASAFSQATNTADLNMAVGNSVSVADTTSGTLELGSNTALGGSITLAGTSTLTVAGSNNITTLTVNNNVLLNAPGGGSNATLAPTTSVLIVNGNIINNATAGTNTLTLGGTASPAAAFSGPNTINGVISDGASGGALTLVKTSTSLWSLSGSTSNTYTGGTIVKGSTSQAGALVLAKTGGAIAIPGNLTIGDGTVQAHVILAGDEQIAPTSTVTFNGVNSGWAYIQLQGHTQTIGGVVEANPGFSVLETREASGTFGASTVKFNVATGTQTYLGFFRDTNAGIDATNSLTLTKTGAGMLQFGAGGTGTGAATTSATAHNYSGGTNIQNGTLQLMASGTAVPLPITGAGNVTLDGGATFAGTLDVNGLSVGITGLNGVSGSVLGQVVNNGGGTAVLSIGSNNNNGSFAGLITNNNNASAGTLGITKVGTGTQILSGASTYTGTTTFAAGNLQVQGTENPGVSGPLGNGSLFFNGGTLQYSSANTFDYSSRFSTAASNLISIDTNGQTVTFNTPLTSSGGTLTKLGSGMLNLPTANTYTGSTTVSNGTLNVTGSLTGGGNTTVSNGTLNIIGSLTGNGTTTTGSVLTVGNIAGQNGVVNVSGSVNSYYTFTLGTNPTAVGVLNMTGGTFTNTTTAVNNTVNFVGQTGYGYLNITGGNFIAKGRFAPSNGVGTTGVTYVGGTGVLDTSAGEWFLMAYSVSGNGGQSMVTVGPGGQLLHAGASNNFGLNMDRANGYAVLNVAGGLLTTSTHNITFGNSSNAINNTTGFMNLAAGTLTFGLPFLNGNSGAGATGNNAYINFAGGTLRANASVTALIPASASNQTFTTNVFGPINNQAATGSTSQNFVGGVTIDTSNNGAGSFAVSLTNPLLGPAGVGITQADINLAGGAGYVGAPFVRFSTPAGGGTPAAGYALINNGQVSGVVITAPGTYASNEVPTVTLTGGGGTGAAVTIDPLTTANTSGGLTKIGAGTLTLSGSSSYAGPTTINSGTVAATILASGGSNSAIGASTNAASNLILDSGILSYTGTTAAITDRNFTLTGNGGGLDASGTTAGTVVFNGNMTPTGTTGSQTFTLSGTGTGATGQGTLNGLVVDGGGTNVTTVTKSGAGTWVLGGLNTYSGPTNINGGTLGVANLTNGGVAGGLGVSSNSAANLVLNGGTLQYTGTGAASTDRNYTFGNATTASGGGFDGQGTGPMVIAGNMNPVNATAGTQVLTLTASAASGANTVSGTITDSSGTALTGLAKSGAGTWVLSAANAYTGATTINAGILTVTGTQANNSPITFTTGGGGVMNISTSGTVNAGAINWAGATAGSLVLNSGILQTNANLTSSSSTGTALTFNGGTLKSGAAITISAALPILFTGNATIDTTGGDITSSSGLAFTGSSGSGTFTLQGGHILSANLNSSSNGWTGNTVITGAGTTLKDTGASVETGSLTVGTGATYDMVANSQSFGGLNGGGTIVNSTGAAAKVFTASGAGGGNFSGAIAPVGTTAGFTGLTISLNNGATQTFSGANTHTYTGATTISNGTLAIAGAQTFDNTAITISAGASGSPRTLAITPGVNGTTVTIGNSITAAAGGTLTIANGSTATPIPGAFTMADNAIATLNLVQGSSVTTGLTIGSAAGSGYVKPTLTFDVGGSNLTDIDLLNVTKAASVGTGGATLFFSALSTSTSLTPGDYIFMTASGGLGASLFTLGNTTISAGTTSYSLSLASSSTTQEILSITALTNSAACYWQGGVDSSWKSVDLSGNTNFVTSAGGGANTQALPDLNSNVTFTANTAGNLSTTLDQDFTINSLTFSGSGTSNTAGTTIASGTGPGTNTLTIMAGTASGNVAGNGITVASGSGPNTISANVALGASQTWTVANGASLTVSGAISGSGFALIKDGQGTLTLSGNNSYTGGTTLTLGTLNLNHNNALGTGRFTVSVGTIDNTSGGLITLANNTQTWNNGGTLTFTGSNALNMGSGAVTFGDATAASFTINNNATVATNTLTVGGSITGGTGGTAGAKTLTINGTGNTALLGNITKGGATSITVTSNSTGTLTLSGTSTLAGLNLQGGAASIIDLGATGNLTVTNAGNSTIQTTLGATINNGTLTLGANDDNVGTPTGTTLTINSKVTGAFEFESFQAAGSTGVVLLNNTANDFTGGILVSSGVIAAPSFGTNGSASGLGKGSTIKLGSGTNAVGVQYLGTGTGTETSNKNISLIGTTGGVTFDQSGTQNLKLTGTFANTGAGAKTITLKGSAGGSGEFTAPIIDSTGTGATSIAKLGSNTWTLSGANTWTGSTNIDAGTLALTSATSQAHGALTFGAAAGNTSAGTLDLTGATATFTNVLVQNNNAAGNNITVSGGKTLTFNGNLTLGYDAGGGTGATQSNLTINGGGALTINGTTITISANQAAPNAGYSNSAILDVTALSSFAATVTNLNVGVGSGTTGAGTINLSNTANTIVATNLTVGSNGANNGSGACNLILGTGTNVIKSDTIVFGSGKGSSAATLKFASQTLGSPGSLNLTNAAGTGAANITIATNTTAGTSGSATGTFDLRGHNVTVNAGTMLVSNFNVAGSTGTGTTGTVSFDTGTFNAATLNLGVYANTSTATTIAPSATLNIGSAGSTGTFSVSGTTTMANHTASAGSTALNSTINVAAGTLNLGTMVMSTKNGASTGNANATINVTGGAVNVTSGSTFTMASNAVVGGSANATLNLTGGSFTSNVDIVKGGGAGTTAATITLNGGLLDMTGHVIGGATAINTLNFQSGTLANVGEINNGAGLTKTTAGTLTIIGTSAYTGTTTVSAGTLLNNGSITGSALVTVATGATYGGSGGIAGALTIQSGGKLAPGNSPGVVTAGGVVTLSSGSTYSVDIGGQTAGNTSTSYDQTNSTNTTGAGIVLAGSNLVVNSFGTFMLSDNTSDASKAIYILTQGGTTGITGNFAGLPEGSTVNLADGNGTAQITYLANWGGSQETSFLTGGNDVALYNVNMVPEPATISALGLAAVGLLARRRRPRRK
jgi:autotransporter-associated beta strand protein